MRIADVIATGWICALLCALSPAANAIEATGTRATVQTSAPANVTLAVAPGLIDLDSIDALASVFGGLNSPGFGSVRVLFPTEQAEFDGCAAAEHYDLLLDVEVNAPIQGYIALARETRGSRGLIFVRRDTRSFTLEDLATEDIALPRGGGFAATELIRAELPGGSFSDHAAGPVADVYQAVFRKQVPAGSGTPRSFNLLPESMREHLRVIHQTPVAPRITIFANQTLRQDTAIALRRGILALSRTRPSLLADAQLYSFEASGSTPVPDRPSESARREGMSTEVACPVSLG
ncbi:MAG: PhnD/SsuA/transferrin family substrate-binding protein [Pseudomonadota bacterium]